MLATLVGSRFERLLVKELHHKDKAHRKFWLCVCDCGKEKAIRSDHLKHGTVSCGCRKKESAVVMEKFRKYKGSHKKLSDDKVCLNWLFRNYRSGAYYRDFAFDLSIEQFHDLTKSCCYYCGTPPAQVFKTKHYPTGYVYNGIDRVDNSKGYVVDNVVPCCGDCNFCKNKMSQDKFLSLVDKIYCNRILNEKRHDQFICRGLT